MLEIGTLDWGYCEVHLRVEEVPSLNFSLV